VYDDKHDKSILIEEGNHQIYFYKLNGDKALFKNELYFLTALPGE